MEENLDVCVDVLAMVSLLLSEFRGLQTWESEFSSYHLKARIAMLTTF